MGWHKSSIRKGVYGEFSKIQEELDEAKDAMDQGQDLMLLIELSDMIGAIDGFAKQRFGFTVEQLLDFAKLRSQIAIEELQEDDNLLTGVERDIVEHLRMNSKSTKGGITYQNMIPIPQLNVNAVSNQKINTNLPDNNTPRL